jgi:NAD(P)-dependent dehydrogenase (short-subunit alcohol dehydrogenase family)
VTTKVALITGTSRPIGIGFAVTTQLAELGYHVVLTAREAARAEQLAEQLRTDGHAASALRLDLIEPATFDDAAAYVAQTFGHLDVLINNATHGPDFTIMSALDADLRAVRTALDADLIGTWGLILAMLPLLKAAPAARSSTSPASPPSRSPPDSTSVRPYERPPTPWRSTCSTS